MLKTVVCRILDLYDAIQKGGGRGLGRFDFQKFCLIKKYQMFRLKTVSMQNVQFYYIKSWIFGIFGNLQYKMTPFASRQFLIFGAESSYRPF